ncbi:MAG: ABC transporter permease [Spirochaetaceae bacterium]|nr:ABC transporter permease [Spirochaetaceae bacterium]MDT8297415.1 ABC transporter permease [Spirochaetaceae bacterium]
MIEAVAMASVPLILAALGGLISERAGVLNISLEGCITAGAFSAAWVLTSGGSPILAALAALLSGLLFGGLLAGMHLGLGANLFIAGLGINLLAPSLAGLISQSVWGHKGTIRFGVDEISRFPASGMLIFAMAMIPLSFGALLMMNRTEFGRRIKTAGSTPIFLSERGIPPQRTQLTALLISSVSAALAGMILVMRIDAFVPGMSSGRGWIALVVIWLGFRSPIGIIVASYLFSLIEIISGRAQGIEGVSGTLILALPYIVAVTALTLATIHRGKRKS